jgi:hypothetical protein
VLKALADARLITTSEDSAGVAHEALIPNGQPCITGWMKTNHGFACIVSLPSCSGMGQLNREPDLLYRRYA